MNKKTSNMEVKRINRNRVFRYMNELEQTSMTEIAAALKMSGPTVLTIVNELKDAGLVEEIGEFQSTGGRKAKAFATVKNAVYTLGVDITRRHVGIAYTNLARQTLQYERIWKIFENTEEYFEEVAELIRKFVKDNQIDEEKIAGMGLSMPGIVDRSRNHMTQSHVLGLSEINLENWTKYMPYPCEVMNDANAAAIAECHDLEKEGGVIYIALSNTVGGAVVFDANLKHAVDDNLYVGDNWRGGEFGHIMIRPDGRQCYCGKKGCFDAYCSAYQLEELSDKEHGKLEDFFAKLKEIGFEACLLSNNKEPRVKMFNEDVQVNYIFDAHKPSVKNYQKAMELMGTDLSNTIFVGDQLFTDVWGAKRTGIRNILVKPIHPKEEIQIVFKRKLEKIVLYFYKKQKRTAK